MELTHEELRQDSILIVDDEAFQRRILHQVLKNVGLQLVSEAESGTAAREMIAKNNFRIVLSDVQMPDMNGLELLRQIRTGQTRGPRDLRFIIMTSFANTEVLGAAIALDVNGFLVKSVSIGGVVEKIRRALSETFPHRAEGDYASVITDLLSMGAGRSHGQTAATALAPSPARSEAVPRHNGFRHSNWP